MRKDVDVYLYKLISTLKQYQFYNNSIFAKNEVIAKTLVIFRDLVFWNKTRLMKELSVAKHIVKHVNLLRCKCSCGLVFDDTVVDWEKILLH